MSKYYWNIYLLLPLCTWTALAGWKHGKGSGLMTNFGSEYVPDSVLCTHKARVPPLCVLSDLVHIVWTKDFALEHTNKQTGEYAVSQRKISHFPVNMVRSVIAPAMVTLKKKKSSLLSPPTEVEETVLLATQWVALQRFYTFFKITVQYQCQNSSLNVPFTHSYTHTEDLVKNNDLGWKRLH